ncbi:Os10g0477301, partial [Oryza sativa Japonica Group]
FCPHRLHISLLQNINFGGSRSSSLLPFPRCHHPLSLSQIWRAGRGGGCSGALQRRRRWRPAGLGSGLQIFVNVLIFVMLECLSEWKLLIVNCSCKFLWIFECLDKFL